MEKQTIKKSIDINAPKEKVWDVMLSDKFTRIWYGEFCEGSHAETDWKVGSKALFKDNSESGLVGKVILNKPYEVISVEYKGIVIAGIEDYKSESAKNVKGGLEKYRLTEKNGVTHLSIECDMSKEYFESMSAAWVRALQKIKEISEKYIGQKIQLNHPAGKKNVRIDKRQYVIIQKAISKSIKEKVN